MIKQLLAVTIVIVTEATSLASAAAEERFQKLTGAQIRTRFSGMQFTDQVHWAETYGPNGQLMSEEMGAKRMGTWRIEKDQLCTTHGKEKSDICVEVWMSGRRVEMRIPGSESSPLDGVLEKPASRR